MSNNLVERADTYFAAIEFNHNVAPAIETDGSAESGGQADPPGF